MKRIPRFFVLALPLCCGLAQQTVEVVAVAPQRFERKLRLPGEILPYQSVDLHARVTGYIEEVLVDKGSIVKAGQLLVKLAAPELNAQRAEAEAKVQAIESQWAEAEAKLIAAQSTYEHLQVAAATPGAVAENEVILAEKAVDAAQAALAVHDNSAKAARSSVDALKKLELYLNVTAPFDGIITERFVHPGALVGPGTGGGPMLKLEQHSRLRLVVPVPETALSGTTLGVSASFTVPAYPDETFSGVIARIPGSLDPKTRTMAVELNVNNPHGRLGPGMYPEVLWPVRRVRPSFLVPSTSIVTTTERMFVIRVRNGRAEYVSVSRGAAGGGQVEIFGPLAANDRIVRRGTDEIREGSAVAARVVKVK
jgi:membrane fusion protein (multidrug efflux system)